MKRPLLWLMAAIALIPSLVWASVDTATSSTQITITNPGSAVTNAAYFAPLSSQNLINSGYLAADGLNQQILDGAGADVPFMPSTGNLTQNYLFSDDGGVFSDETANNGTPNGIMLLPSTLAVDDAFYVGMPMASRIVRFNVGTAGAGTWTLVWEYFNDPAWVSLANVTDGTNGFMTAGINVVSFDLPAAMPQSDVDSVSSYWVRARVSATSGPIQQPLGTQVWNDSGYYAGFVSSVASLDSSTNTLYNGLTGAEIRTFHHYFPGETGITTADAADLEPGSGTWEIDYQGYVNTTATAGYLVQKGNALSITTDGAGGITGSVGLETPTDYFSSTSDGSIGAINVVYATARGQATGTVSAGVASNFVGQSLSGGDYSVDRMFFFFDTSAIPDGAVIISASVQLVCDLDTSITDFLLTVQNGQPTFPTDPLATTDYLQSQYSGNGGSLTTAGIVCNGTAYSDIPLNASGLGWINDTGVTKLAIRSSLDISATAPTTGELIRVLMTETGGSSTDPKINVTYLVPTSVSKAGVTSGEHRIRFGTDATNLYISVDAGAQTTTPKVAVTNSSSDWQWVAEPQITTYVEYLKYVVAGSQEVWYQLESLPSTTIEDRSGNGHDGIPSYPEIFTPFVATVGSLTPIEVRVDTGETDEPIPAILPPNNSNLSQSGGNWNNFWFAGVLGAMDPGGDWAPNFWGFVMIFLIWLAVTIFFSVICRGFLLLPAIASTSTAAGFYALGGIDLWPVFLVAFLWGLIVMVGGKAPTLSSG